MTTPESIDVALPRMAVALFVVAADDLIDEFDKHISKNPHATVMIAKRDLLRVASDSLREKLRP